MDSTHADSMQRAADDDEYEYENDDGFYDEEDFEEDGGDEQEEADQNEPNDDETKTDTKAEAPVADDGSSDAQAEALRTLTGGIPIPGIQASAMDEESAVKGIEEGVEKEDEGHAPAVEGQEGEGESHHAVDENQGEEAALEEGNEKESEIAPEVLEEREQKRKEASQDLHSSVVFTLDKELDDEAGMQRSPEKPLISVFIPAKKTVGHRSTQLRRLHQKLESEVQEIIHASVHGAKNPPKIPLGRKHPGIKYSKKAKDIKYYGKGERPANVDAYFTKPEREQFLPADLKKKLHANDNVFGQTKKRMKPRVPRAKENMLMMHMKELEEKYGLVHRESAVPSVPSPIVEAQEDDEEMENEKSEGVGSALDEGTQGDVLAGHVDFHEDAEGEDVHEEDALPQGDPKPPSSERGRGNERPVKRTLKKGTFKGQYVSHEGTRNNKSNVQGVMPVDRDFIGFPSKGAYMIQSAYYGPPTTAALASELEKKDALVEAERMARKHTEKHYSAMLKRAEALEEEHLAEIAALKREVAAEKKKAKQVDLFRAKAVRASEVIQKHKNQIIREKERQAELEKEVESLKGQLGEIQHKLHSNTILLRRRTSTAGSMAGTSIMGERPSDMGVKRIDEVEDGATPTSKSRKHIISSEDNVQEEPEDAPEPLLELPEMSSGGQAVEAAVEAPAVEGTPAPPEGEVPPAEEPAEDRVDNEEVQQTKVEAAETEVTEEAAPTSGQAPSPGPSESVATVEPVVSEVAAGPDVVEEPSIAVSAEYSADFETSVELSADIAQADVPTIAAPADNDEDAVERVDD